LSIEEMMNQLNSLKNPLIEKICNVNNIITQNSSWKNDFYEEINEELHNRNNKLHASNKELETLKNLDINLEKQLKKLQEDLKKIDNSDSDDSEEIYLTQIDCSDSEEDVVEDVEEEEKKVEQLTKLEQVEQVEQVEQLKKLEELEQLKKKTDAILESNMKQFEEDQKNAIEYNINIQNQEFLIKKENEMLEKEYNVFISARDHTYGLIYDKFFVKKQIKDWDCVPAFFMIKFPIFVFLDGRNCDGDIVRPRILHTNDDFRLYRLCYDVITSGNLNYDLSDDDKQLIDIFVETYPKIEIITEEQIMCSLNERDANNPDNQIFNEDIISMYSNSACSSDEDSE
jgi:hypothetical protein